MSFATGFPCGWLVAVVCSAIALLSSTQTTHACDVLTAGLPASSQTTARTADHAPATLSDRIARHCSVDAAVLSELIWKNAVLIDLRLPTDLPEYSVPGALVVSRNALNDALLSALQAPVLLIGAGFDDAALIAVCTSLADATDRPVAVLRGGLPAWMQAHGLAVAERDMRLDEAQFGRLLADDRAIVWVLEGSSFATHPELLGEKGRIRSVSPRQWRRQRTAAAVQDAPHVLLASDEAVQRWSLAPMPDVWRYAGDAQRLATWRRHQHAALAARDQRLRGACVWNAY